MYRNIKHFMLLLYKKASQMAKILIVDDEPHFKILIRQKFRKEINDDKYKFLFALNGKKALPIIKENPDISVIISDINMPEMDGISLVNHIKKLQPNMKIIIMSAYTNIENIKESTKHKISNFITKPIKLSQLEKIIYKSTC